MQSDTGGRFEAVLASQDASGARFAVQLSTQAGVWSSEASVSHASGQVEWGSWRTEPGNAEPPAWLCKYLHAALRAAWRAHSEDGWPRRFTRWREAPDPRRARDADET